MSEANSNNRAAAKSGGPWARNLAIWVGCAFLWFVFDRATKAYFDGFNVGSVVWQGIPGVLQFSLVHNVGIAWGAFAGQVSTVSIFTGIMCIGIAAFSVYWARSAGRLEMFALGILFAGGIGNLFDRIVNGYVVDFITPLFISFPTFNVADIGVTCGIALLAIIWVVQIAGEGKQSSSDAPAPSEAKQAESADINSAEADLGKPGNFEAVEPTKADQFEPRRAHQSEPAKRNTNNQRGE